MAAGVRVEGVEELRRHLRRLSADLGNLDAFPTIAKRGAALAASYAPRRTENLARSIIGARSGKNRATIRANAIYAGAINYGWRRRGIEPRLFLQRADEALRPIAIRAIEGDINRLIKTEGLA